MCTLYGVHVGIHSVISHANKNKCGLHAFVRFSYVGVFDMLLTDIYHEKPNLKLSSNHYHQHEDDIVKNWH